MHKSSVRDRAFNAYRKAVGYDGDIIMWKSRSKKTITVRDRFLGNSIVWYYGNKGKLERVR